MTLLILAALLLWSGAVCIFILAGTQEDMNSWHKRKWLWWETAAPVVFVVSFIGMLLG